MSRNLPNTQAYLKLKKQVQETFDLAVVSCYAIPALKLQMSLVEKGKLTKLPTPDYYPEGTNSIEQLRQQSMEYKSKIAKFAVLSCFSFFEAFVFDAIKEMIDFHGGLEHFQNKNQITINITDSNVLKSKQVLRGKPDKGKDERYKKYSSLLKEAGYRFPSSLLSGIGIKLLLNKISTMKSVDIPDLLLEGLNVPLSEKEIENFHNARHLRNSIAHGETISITLQKAGEVNDALKLIAYKLDKHLNEHFLINENFA